MNMYNSSRLSSRAGQVLQTSMIYESYSIIFPGIFPTSKWPCSRDSAITIGGLKFPSTKSQNWIEITVKVKFDRISIINPVGSEDDKQLSFHDFVKVSIAYEIFAENLVSKLIESIIISYRLECTRRLIAWGHIRIF